MKNNIYLISILCTLLTHSQYLIASELAAKDITLSNLQLWIDSKENTLEILGEPDSKSTLYNEIDRLTIIVWNYKKSEIHFTNNHTSGFVLNDRRLALTKLKSLFVGATRDRVYEYLKESKLDIIEGKDFIKVPIKDTLYYLLIGITNNSISQLSIWQDS